MTTNFHGIQPTVGRELQHVGCELVNKGVDSVYESVLSKRWSFVHACRFDARF